MAGKRSIIQLGTKVRVKSREGKDDIDGVITDYLTDDNKEIVGYEVKPIDSSLSNILVALDNTLEILKQ